MAVANESRAEAAGRDKVMSLAEAAALVHDGDHLALSGFSIARNAVAFSRELIRQGRKELTISQCILGLDSALLVAAGRVKRIIYGGGSLDRFGQLQCVNRAIEKGEVSAEYYSSLAVCFRYLAGALGVPFMPIKSLLGSDILARLQQETAPDKVREMDCPFTGERLVLLRALEPDIAVVQAPVADAEGNTRIYGPLWDTVEAAKAARRVIVIAEELVPTQVIRQQPEQTLIPGLRVTAVVPLPFGAHPTSLFRYYDCDREHLRLYVEADRRKETLEAYLEQYVLGPKDHFDYLERVGGLAKLSSLREEGLRLEVVG